MKKRKLFLFLPLLLALMLGAVGCGNDDDNDVAPVNEERNVITPSKNVTISNFLKTTFVAGQDKPFDFNKSISNDKERPCIIVNSQKEFKEVYTGNQSLPAIDFSEFTLVIGKIVLGAGTFIDDMVIRQIDANKSVLAIHSIIDGRGTYLGVNLNVYYWELFPKFHASEITVEVSQDIVQVDKEIINQYFNLYCYEEE